MQEIKIYTTNSCPYCVQAKRLLKQEGLEYTEINLENLPELRQELAAANDGWRTVPMIFIGSKFIGGFDDLAVLKNSKKLANLVGA
jgi:glutaredoxin 3